MPLQRRLVVGMMFERPSIQPVPTLAPLQVFIGRWITEGTTIAREGTPALSIVASDIYEWAPGGHFVVHPAYGRIGSAAVGGIEIIGYDPSTRQFETHFFDSHGNTTRQTLSYDGGRWTWLGTRTRCVGTFSDDGNVLTACHERSDDGVHWVPSMDVTLRRLA